MIRLTIHTDTRAFQDHDGNYAPAIELSRIFRELAKHADAMTLRMDTLIHDVSGNAIGELTTTGYAR